MIKSKFHGTNMIGWIGCVETRNDTKAEDGLMLGRVQVRVLGYHSKLKTENDKIGEGIPTEKLLWAYPINSINSASMNGIGHTPMGPVPGTWVFGISMDGQAMQDLYILGTLGGVPQEAPKPKIGFNDPRKDGPWGTFPRKEFLKESDVNRLARNQKRHPMLDAKKKERTKDIEIANPGGTRTKWDEPESGYEAAYPFNHVYESESGHIIEIDDTPENGGTGGPRKHEWHPKGGYTETVRDGTRTQKIVGDDFEIVLKDRNLYIKGNLNVTIGGDASILVKGNMLAEVEKDVVVDSKKNILLKATENIVMAAKNIQILGDSSVTILSNGPLVALGGNSIAADASAGMV